MLDLTPSNLRAEINAAKALRKERLGAWERMLKSYYGPAYGGGNGKASLENTAFEVVASVNPQLVYSNPRVNMTSKRPEFQPKRVEALEFATNRWIKDTDPRLLYEEIAVDFQFAFGVILTKPARTHVRTARRTTEDFDDPLYRPSSERVDPNEFVCDPVAKSMRQARWMGHPVTMDLDDLRDMARNADPDAGWNLDAIEQMVEGEGKEELDGEDRSVTRKSVTFYEIWVPEHELDESPGHEKGYHGSWHTVTMSDNVIRDPRPAFVPRWGAYSFFGGYVVPGQQHPLSLLVVNDGLDQALNLLADGEQRAMERHKRILMVEESDPELVAKVESAIDGGVVTVKTDDLKAKINEVELGGTTEIGQAAIAITRDRRDRGVGLQDAQRGEVSGIGTATEQVIAQQASSIRISHLQQKFRHDGVRNHLRTVAWYLDMDSRTVLYLGSGEKERAGVEDPAYIGGIYPENAERYKAEFPEAAKAEPMEDDGYRADDFDLLEIDIETHSMDRKDDPVLAARAVQALQMAMQVAPMRVQAPWMDWDTLLDQFGDSINYPNFGSLINGPLADAVASMMLQQQVQEEPQTQGRLASDVVKSPEQNNPFGVASGGTDRTTAKSAGAA